MNFKDNLAALIKVKTIVTLAVIFAFAVLALMGKISADNVMIIVSSVISFYFGTQHEKSGNDAVPQQNLRSAREDAEERKNAGGVTT